MAEIRDLSDAFSWPVSRLADCFEVHRQTLTKKIKAHGLAPTGTHRGNPTYNVNQVARIIYSPLDEMDGDDQPVDLDRNPEARKAWWQSENERVKFQKSIGQLIPDHVFAREISQVIKAVANPLDSVGDLLERDVGLDPRQRDRVDKVVDGIREAMYERLIAIEPADDLDPVEGEDG